MTTVDEGMARYMAMHDGIYPGDSRIYAIIRYSAWGKFNFKICDNDWELTKNMVRFISLMSPIPKVVWNRESGKMTKEQWKTKVRSLPTKRDFDYQYWEQRLTKIGEIIKWQRKKQ